MKSPIFKLLLLLSLFANGIFLYDHLLDTQKNDSSNDTNVAEKTTSRNTDDIAYESGKAYPLMRIVDGDTLVVGFNGVTQYVRLLGIDAPEPNDPGGPQCYAEEATTHLQEIARTGLVVLHFDESQGMHDSYGRVLAYVELPDGTDLGKKMIEDGYAHEFTYRAEYKRQHDYKTAETASILEGRGLWADEACNT